MPNIIAGKYRKTKLEVPTQLVRPTSALKREAIFSIIESYAMQNSIEIYKNKSIIDIFAGSGLIGLEAISRGIKKSYFIENNKSVAKVLMKNCKKICKNNEYEIFHEKAINGLDNLFSITPSLIFIDPPYNKENIRLILLKIIQNKIKSKNTIVIIETEKNEQILIPEEFTFFKEKIYGKTKLIFLN